MSKKLKKVTNEEWLDEFSSFVGRETQKLLRGYAKSHDQTAEDLLARYLNHLIKNTLVDIVTKYEKESVIRTQEELYELTYKDYKAFKFKLESEMADAFTQVMSKFSGKSLDYYCEISLMPDPINTEPA